MRLVVQGSSLRFEHLQYIHQLAAAKLGQQFMQIGAHAYYLPAQTSINAEIQTFCSSQHIDCAYVPDHLTLKKIGLVVMDMDSTLINIECIDEIADMCGLKPQVAAITERAMRGEIEFAESLTQRVALLKGLDEGALQRVVDERLQLNPGAQAWIDCCRENGIKTMLVSGGFNFFAERVQAITGLDYFTANQLEMQNGQLTGKVLGTIVDAQAKADFLMQKREQLGLSADQVIAIGDGANDLKMMSAAAAGIAYHAKPIVQQQASFALNFSGLDGAIYLFTTGN
jgi:phosphoserine phosphatase